MISGPGPNRSFALDARHHTAADPPPHEELVVDGDGYVPEP